MLTVRFFFLNRKTFPKRLIDWCLMPTLAVFQLYCGVFLKESDNSLKEKTAMIDKITNYNINQSSGKPITPTKGYI